MPKIKNKTKTVINKVINVSRNEWPRIILSWSIQFFYRVAYTIIWIALIALFTTQFGIINLPYFFIIYAFARILGSFIYSYILNIFEKDQVILATVIIGATLLVISMLLKFVHINLFIFTAIPVLAVFLSQTYILCNSFIEDLFTPLESERTFPIIESAETIGAIVGAIILTLLSNSVPIYNFVTLAVISYVLIVPIILYHRRLLKRIPFIKFVNKNHKPHKVHITNIKKFTSNFKYLPFLKVILIMIIGQWLFTNLLEFQFTKAVYNNMAADLPNPAQELTHGLSTIHIYIYSFALIMQLLIASRIISSLGVIGSLLLHPVVSLLSMGAMLFNFGFSTAILSKLNFEMTTIIFKSAYHTSYYAIENSIREQAREIIDGFSRPIGMIIGMTLLIILQNIFTGSALNTIVTSLMVVVMAGMMLLLLKNEKNYSNISIRSLLHSKIPTLQLNAIEVLGQKGHKNAGEVLTRTLKNEGLDEKVKIKILDTLGHMKEHESILEVLDHVEDESEKVRLAALKALNRFDVIQKKHTKRPFSLYRINNLLKRQFSLETNNDIKALIIKILAKLNHRKIVTFILELLNSEDRHIKANCIGACYFFDDINLIHYLLPYVKSDDPKIKANTIIALWKYPKYRQMLNQELKKMINSEEKEIRIEAFYIIGQVDQVEEKNKLKEYLHSDQSDERLAAALALARLRSPAGISIIGDTLIYSEGNDKESLKHIVDSLPYSMKEKVNNYIRHSVSIYINELLSNVDVINTEELDKNTLLRLRNAYDLVNEHEEVQNIDSILLQFKPV